MDYRAIDRASASPVEVSLDGRTAERFTLMMRTAKLMTEVAEHLCVIRDVSSSGLSARLFHPLAPVGRVTLEMQTGDRHVMYPVWQREGEAGFRFCTPVDVESMIRNCSRFPKRELRFAADIDVDLHARGECSEAILRNFSQQGAMLECADHFSLGQVLRLESDHFPQTVGRVRWRMGNRYGLAFDSTIQMLELANLIVRMNRTAPVTMDSPAIIGMRSVT